MIVQFEKCELKIDQIHKEEFSEESFGDHEIRVIELIQGWLKKEPNFAFKTSGSTGKAKTILIERKKIEYSCQSTMEHLDPNQKFSSSLLCLNPNMIGGAMVVFRALHRNLKLTVVKATSNPFQHLDAETKFDLVSMVPMQLHGIRSPELDSFNTILLGGASFSGKVPKTKALIYETFGMTETVSHFALRRLGEEEFQCVGDMLVKQEDTGCLSINGTLTDHNWLITNDIVTINSTKKFKWLGRSDFVINSGGVKINPEAVERKIAPVLDGRFMISSMADEALGSKMVLVIEGEEQPFSLDSVDFSTYEEPKEVHFLSNFVLTPSQKIDRIKTMKRLTTEVN